MIGENFGKHELNWSASVNIAIPATQEESKKEVPIAPPATSEETRDAACEIRKPATPAHKLHTFCTGWARSIKENPEDYRAFTSELNEIMPAYHLEPALGMELLGPVFLHRLDHQGDMILAEDAKGGSLSALDARQWHEALKSFLSAAPPYPPIWREVAFKYYTHLFSNELDDKFQKEIISKLRSFPPQGVSEINLQTYAAISALQGSLEGLSREEVLQSYEAIQKLMPSESSTLDHFIMGQIMKMLVLYPTIEPQQPVKFLKLILLNDKKSSDSYVFKPSDFQLFIKVMEQNPDNYDLHREFAGVITRFVYLTKPNTMEVLTANANFFSQCFEIFSIILQRTQKAQQSSMGKAKKDELLDLEKHILSGILELLMLNGDNMAATRQLRSQMGDVLNNSFCKVFSDPLPIAVQSSQSKNSKRKRGRVKPSPASNKDIVDYLRIPSEDPKVDLLRKTIALNLCFTPSLLPAVGKMIEELNDKFLAGKIRPSKDFFDLLKQSSSYYNFRKSSRDDQLAHLEKLANADSNLNPLDREKEWLMTLVNHPKREDAWFEEIYSREIDVNVCVQDIKNFINDPLFKREQNAVRRHSVDIVEALYYFKKDSREDLLAHIERLTNAYSNQNPLSQEKERLMDFAKQPDLQPQEIDAWLEEISTREIDLDGCVQDIQNFIDDPLFRLEQDTVRRHAVDIIQVLSSESIPNEYNRKIGQQIFELYNLNDPLIKQWIDELMPVLRAIPFRDMVAAIPVLAIISDDESGINEFFNLYQPSPEDVHNIQLIKSIRALMLSEKIVLDEDCFLKLLHIIKELNNPLLWGAFSGLLFQDLITYGYQEDFSCHLPKLFETLAANHPIIDINAGYQLLFYFNKLRSMPLVTPISEVFKENSAVVDSLTRHILMCFRAGKQLKGKSQLESTTALFPAYMSAQIIHSMSTTPAGASTKTATNEVLIKTLRRMHPEACERFEAMIDGTEGIQDLVQQRDRLIAESQQILRDYCHAVDQELEQLPSSFTSTSAPDPIALKVDHLSQRSQENKLKEYYKAAKIARDRFDREVEKHLSSGANATAENLTAALVRLQRLYATLITVRNQSEKNALDVFDKEMETISHKEVFLRGMHEKVYSHRTALEDRLKKRRQLVEYNTIVLQRIDKESIASYQEVMELAIANVETGENSIAKQVEKGLTGIEESVDERINSLQKTAIFDEQEANPRNYQLEERLRALEAHSRAQEKQEKHYLALIQKLEKENALLQQQRLEHKNLSSVPSKSTDNNRSASTPELWPALYEKIQELMDCGDPALSDRFSAFRKALDECPQEARPSNVQMLGLLEACHFVEGNTVGSHRQYAYKTLNGETLANTHVTFVKSNNPQHQRGIRHILRCCENVLDHHLEQHNRPQQNRVRSASS